MKRDKRKKVVLGRASKRRAGRQPAPDNPVALATTEAGGSSGAATCLPEIQADTSPSTTLEMPAAGKAELKHGGFEPPLKEEMVSSSLQDSTDTSADELASIGNTIQRLAFLLGDEEYGIDIRMVKEIIRPANITSVPRAPSYIRGIISLRGTVLPILDLCQLLSMTDSKPTKTQRILVVNLEEMPIGIIVDAVTEVVELKEEELQPPTALMTNTTADHIIGMGRYKGRLIILLDLEKVYLARHSLAKAQQERIHAHSH